MFSIFLDLHPLSSREIEDSMQKEFIPDIKLIKERVPLKNVSTSKLFERIHRGSYPELYKNKAR